jgi:fibronectin-binding autotransporter adhesin
MWPPKPSVSRLPRLEVLEVRCAPAVVSWDGGPTGNGADWLDAANWVGDVLPGVADDAVVNPTGNNPEIVVGATAVRSVTSSRALRLTGPLTFGTGSFSGPASAFSDITLAGGMLDPLDQATVTLSGTVGGSGTFTFRTGRGVYFRAGGAGLTVAIPVAVQGNAYFSGGAGAPLHFTDSLAVYGFATFTGPDTDVRVDGLLSMLASINVECRMTLAAGAKVAAGRFLSIDSDAHSPNGTPTLLTVRGGLALAGILTFGVHGGNYPPQAFGLTLDSCDLTVAPGATVAGLGYPSSPSPTVTLSALTAPARIVNQGTMSGGSMTVLSQGGAGTAFTNSGTLFLGNSVVRSDVAIVNAAGAAVYGTGNYAGDFGGPGSVAPGGDGAGRLAVTGNVNLGGPFSLDLKGTAPGTGYDQLAASGMVTLVGALSLHVDLAQPAPAVGTAYRIIDNLSANPVQGTFAGLPQGTAINVGVATLQVNYAGGDGNDVVLTVTAPATVTTVQISSYTAAPNQRSRVDLLKVVFSSVITYAGAPTAAYSLQKIVGSVPAGSVGIAVNTVTVAGHSEATITFTTDTEFGSLRDGHYRLTVVPNQISSGGVFMTGDLFTNFHRRFGDVNGDQHIDIADFSIFNSTYNSMVGQPNYLAYFDFNNDGHIDILDFGQFSIRMFTFPP